MSATAPATGPDTPARGTGPDPAPTPTGSGPGSRYRRVTAAQLFDRDVVWTLAVGVPVLVSVLRLWAEAGGDLQTTLLLVANVGPVNLFAALVVTGTWLVTAVLVAVFAIGSLTRAGAEPADRPVTWPSLFAQLTAAAPGWLRVAVFGLAALTWPVLHLPLLWLAWVATFGRHRSGPLSRWRVAGWALVAAGYGYLFGSTLLAAVAAGYALPAALIVAPPLLLAVGAARPAPAGLARHVAVAAQVATLALVPFVAAPLIATPVLPLSVITVTEGDGQPPRPVRGYVVEVNDNTTAVLRVRGGVDFVPNIKVAARILCPDQGQATRYRLWVHGVHVEDSLLQGLGRKRRPVVNFDPRCRPTVPEREPGQ